MRILLVAAALLSAACDSFPVTVEPRIQVSPYLAVYQLRGEIAMQNDPGTGPVDNRPQSLRNFGFDNYEEDIGVRADIGDGFAGLRIDYYHLDQNTTRTGVLDDEFGNLLAGDMARMSARMDEWRVTWVQEVFTHRGTFREHDLDLVFGAGVTYAQRELDMHMRSADGLRQQNVEMSGGVFYPAARCRLSWRGVHLDADYAISPHLDIGGDFDGVLQDIEARLSYQVPFQDVTLFAGWRYSVLEGEGTTGGLGFDADLRLDGVQFGLQVTF